MQSSRGNKRQRESSCAADHPAESSPSSATQLPNYQNKHRRDQNGSTQISSHEQRQRQSRAGDEGGGQGEDDNDSSNISSSGNNGRDQQDDPYGDFEFDFMQDVKDLPNDTMAAILTLQRQFYGKRTAPTRRGGGVGTGSAGQVRARTGLVLQHQIYTVLQNRTAVDVELTAMRKDNTLRTFRLSTGREDWGIMSTEHYLILISKGLGYTQEAEEDNDIFKRGTTSSRSGGQGKNAPRTARDKGVPPTVGRSARTCNGRSGISGTTKLTASKSKALPSARDVLKYLIQSNRRAYASRQEVANAMREVEKDEEAKVDTVGGVIRKGEETEMRNEGGVSEDEELDLISIKKDEARVVSLVGELIRAGFLLPRRDVGREEAYWFSVPQLGKLIAAISRGRKDIVSMLKRTRYKEIRRAALETKNPAKTGLPLSFHVRDLVGLGMVREFETPSGAFLRLSPET